MRDDGRVVLVVELEAPRRTGRQLKAGSHGKAAIIRQMYK
jgi:hypothetical protein